MVAAFLILYLPESVQPPTKSPEKSGVILLSHIKMKTCIIDTLMKIKDCDGGLFTFWWWRQGAVVMDAMVPAVVVLMSVTAVLLRLRSFTGNA
jgi:hypothetical protein